MRTKQEVTHAFTPQGKLTEEQKMRLLHLQNAFHELATDIIEYAPDCPDRTSSLRKLLEAKFTATQAVTHHVVKGAPVGKQKESPPEDPA